MSDKEKGRKFVFIAVIMMRDFLVSVTELDATDALMLLSLVGNAAISQVVDPLQTARMELPRTVLEAYGVRFA